MEEETIKDFKWLFSGGVLMVAGEILIVGMVNNAFLVGALIMVLGVFLLAGGFFGKEVRQLLSPINENDK